jgi:hypothetical protein
MVYIEVGSDLRSALVHQRTVMRSEGCTDWNNQFSINSFTRAFGNGTVYQCIGLSGILMFT